jgi:hypothetical protein
MKKNYFFLTMIVIGLPFGIISQNITFQAKAGYQQYKFLNSVYKNTHDQWQGMGTAAVIMFKEKFFLNLEYSTLKADVIDRSIFFRDQTTLKTFGAGIGYQHSLADRIKLRPAIIVGRPKWENVSGVNLHVDLGFQYNIFKKWSIFFDTGVKFLRFDIKAPSDIVNQYRNATLLNFQFGLSFRS